MPFEKCDLAVADEQPRTLAILAKSSPSISRSRTVLPCLGGKRAMASRMVSSVVESSVCDRRLDFSIS